MEAFTERYRLSQGIDPETDDIDSIDGYLRDYRVYTDEAQVARNSLRMDLTEGDRKNAMFSQVASELPTAGLTSSVNSLLASYKKESENGLPNLYIRNSN